MRLGLGTFDTTDLSACAYETVAWHLRQPCREMDSPDVMTLEWAQRLAPPPRFVTEEDRRQNRRRERRLGIAEMDEHAFFAQRRAERRVE
ncbi:hypothetical protein D1007_42892 [Hordeum vulgare]|nr:hypothetical protein D1007_42892 [Hordeum vulgare]